MYVHVLCVWIIQLCETINNFFYARQSTCDIILHPVSSLQNSHKKYIIIYMQN